MSNRRNGSLSLVGVLMVLGLLVSCSPVTGEAETGTAVQSPVVASSMPTPPPEPSITPTSLPLALRVNGVGVPLAEFELQTALLTQASEAAGAALSAEEITERVTSYFVDTELLAQAARSEGFTLATGAPAGGELDARLEALVQEAGGLEAFQRWLSEHGFTEDIFRAMYARELEAAWKRDQIMESVGTTAEQVEARQILVYDAAQAEQILRQLKGGAEFATLAAEIDPLTRGELGWFPRGYLFLPEVEEAVFALQPGQFTEIVQTRAGYHILQLIAREADHPLSAGAARALAHQAVDRWLEAQRSASTVERLIP